MTDYFVENKETGKIELYFDKSTYMSLTDEQKQSIKSNFLFSRYSKAWISRRKFPNLYLPKQIAIQLGLEDQGSEGERLSFEEQQERKAERAEARAERYEAKAEKAEARAEALQAPINRMSGDIAFFTQPNINTSAGRAFTRQRDRMWASYEKGMDEFRKSAYYLDRAETARKSTNIPDKGFCQRRIDEAEKGVRAQQRNIESYKQKLEKIEAGEELKSYYSGNIITADDVNRWIDEAEEIIESYVSKIAYYDALMQQQGGLLYSKENLKKGDLVKVARWGAVKVVRTGPKNFTFEFLTPYMTYADGTPMQGKAAYAEIKEKVTE